LDTEKKIIDVQELAHVFYEMDTEDVMREYFSFSCKGSKRQYRDRTKIRIKQSFEEVIELFEFLNDKDIKSYLEVGIQQGGSYFLTTGYLSSLQSNIIRATGLDRYNECQYMIDHNKGKMEFVFEDCLAYEPQGTYDYIFIDTNQKYDHSGAGIGLIIL
jgi:hypothetical protein